MASAKETVEECGVNLAPCRATAQNLWLGQSEALVIVGIILLRFVGQPPRRVRKNWDEKFLDARGEGGHRGSSGAKTWPNFEPRTLVCLFC